MPPRGTARSSASRNQASSPPKAPTDSQSPVGRRTRSSRSRSVDPEHKEASTNTKRISRRGERETSVSSIESGRSASSTGSRARKHTRKPAVNRDLSIVAEDNEGDEEAGGFEPSDDDDSPIENVEVQNQGQSPGAMSQMSGTTAITSYSAQEIAKLDPIMAEILPELLESASKILEQLAPVGAIETEEQVNAIVKDLKILGSRRGKHLRLHEQRFMAAKAYYGGDIYIQSSFVLRKLLGTDNPEQGNFRPDPVIHAANLATLLSEFLVLQPRERKAKSTLQGVCRIFPEAFIGKFDESEVVGDEDLVDENFDLALDLYTQAAIVNLSRMEEDGARFTPDQALADVFYDQYDQADQNGRFAELTDGGVLKNILRPGQTYSQTQVDMIQERLGLLSATIRYSEEARQAGDLVDFDQLNEMFPWISFITHMVQWSRRRFTEVSEAVSGQGGIEEITQSLIELIQTNDSQADVRYDAPQPATRKRELLPAADITQSGNQSFLSAGSVQTLMRLKKKTIGNSSVQDPPISQESSSRPQPRSTKARSAPVPVPIQGNRNTDSVQSHDDDYQAIIDEDLDNRPRSTAEYTAAWNENSKEKNKENHKPMASKRRLIDRQPDAEKVVWDESQDSVARHSPPKRTRAESHHSDESEDQGFQEDQRHIDPDRRAIAPPGPRFSPIHDTSPPKKRQRVHQEMSPRGDSNRAEAQRTSERVEPERRRSQVSDDSDTESSGETPPPTASEISIAARYATAKAKGVQVPKGRRAWSDRDSNLLSRRIEKYGCAWSTIHHLGKWDVQRDQVALKDRARNMKVNMLKTGQPLPLNWEQVPLGKKEIASVRAKFPDYEP
ncbi:hypothetical protein ONS95_001773 [Cadophora gregata]|uniref:uncharacterized protein n=1 Tax=Cadophora gregata TaxID=51156 RepID=UPI0026DC31F8|nr:uncharacterized protein ONS95_001773 [Cadophora gregata]KAK0111412.1 hypothetical protein ONS95_001773 [Cadophora gregata]KAK0112110.1 hypothetical protein ONS96_001368 [Cadophora gregata f. sp. sojae]